jgi:iron complex transport system ATP-binding protein
VEDKAIVEESIGHLDLGSMADKFVDELSGGQRQRAWIAMTLAQETPLLLLDEPTTYLDISHQLQVIDLVARLNADEGRTVVMVLHDLNEAARVSHRIVAMRDGRILRAGTPDEVLQPELLSELYGVRCDVLRHAVLDRPFCVPRGDAPAPGREHHDGRPLFRIDRLHAGYGERTVLCECSLEIPAGKVTAVIGPNACGKSTLLRACGRLLRPRDGCVRLEEREVQRGSHRAFARRLALLGQGATAPAGVVVEDVVAAGRMPHQGIFRQWRTEDETAVEAALEATDLADLRLRPLGALSGGQRQRAWFGMTLAQATPALLLDEPTTFLDLAAQIDLLDRVRALNRDHGRSIVMVLHDLNLASRYADHLIVLRDGEVVAAGAPSMVITADLLRAVFAIEALVVPDPVTGLPLVMPVRARGPDED